MAPTAVLELRRIRAQFGEKIVLDDVNVRIAPGEFIGLIGPNGAGKTTLLKVALGLLAPTQGQVLVHDKPVRRGHRAVGYVPQKAQIDPDTPLTGHDFVALGLDGTRWGVPLPSRGRREQVNQVLAAVDALPFADTPVGRLSGGELQRLLIAQALLTKPDILLLDEPLSNLDIRSSHEIVRLVDRVARSKQMAVLLVAHDMNPLLPVMDKILYVARGKSLMGPVDQVITTESLSRLYGYTVEVLRVRGRIIVVGGPDAEVALPDVEGEAHCGSGEAASL